MVQEWHFLCHVWLLSCCLMTPFSVWHTEESWSWRATLLLSQGNCWYPRISLFEKSWLLLRCLLLARFFKQHNWRERKIRNILFWWLNFTSLWNTNKPSLSLLKPPYSFSTWLLLYWEQQEAAVLSLAVTEGRVVVSPVYIAAASVLGDYRAL